MYTLVSENREVLEIMTIISPMAEQTRQTRPLVSVRNAAEHQIVQRLLDYRWTGKLRDDLVPEENESKFLPFT